MWPRRDLIDLVGVAHPIVQAPMSGLAAAELVVAVTNAGGLGSLGCAGQPLDIIRSQVQAIRAGTDRPFSMNFLLPSRAPSDTVVPEPMRTRLARYYDELGLGAVSEQVTDFPLFDEERLALVLELRPQVVSFHFGLPNEAALRAIKATGARILSSATTVAEARLLEAAGADAIIAQGFEAGGHRGTFTAPSDAGSIGTMALVPQVVDAVKVPVIAAGGIADGRGIAAAFALGAGGVQMGTAFLACQEAAAPPPYRDALLASRDDSTCVTRVLSGHLARVLHNRFVKELRTAADEALTFPAQLSLTAPLRRASAERGSADFMAMWAGQAAPLARPLPAAMLVGKVVEEARMIFSRAREAV